MARTHDPGGARGDDRSDCCPAVCAYQPRLVGLLRSVLEEARLARDEAPSDGYDLADLLAPDGDTVERGRWAAIAADLERAEAAGCRTDEEVSAFLCPLAGGH